MSNIFLITEYTNIVNIKEVFYWQYRWITLYAYNASAVVYIIRST
jgi:hypothetical protein